MSFPKLIKFKKFPGIPPKSTNNLYFCLGINFLVKSYSYRLFRALMESKLKNSSGAKGFLESDETWWKNKGLYIEVGIIKEFDLDNTLKGIIDSLQAVYGFNDNQIKGIICRKVVVGNFPLDNSEWSKQYISIGLLEYQNEDCEVFSQDEINDVLEIEKTLAPDIMEKMYRSVNGDWTLVDDHSDPRKQTIYLEVVYPDIDNVVRTMNIDRGRLIAALESSGLKRDYHIDVAKNLGIEGKDQIEKLKKQLTNQIRDPKLLDELLTSLETD